MASFWSFVSSKAATVQDIPRPLRGIKKSSLIAFDSISLAIGVQDSLEGGGAYPVPLSFPPVVVGHEVPHRRRRNPGSTLSHQIHFVDLDPLRTILEHPRHWEGTRGLQKGAASGQKGPICPGLMRRGGRADGSVFPS